MTEAEWLVCERPVPMLERLREHVSARKLHLFGCMCCRLRWHFLVDARSRRAVELAELWVDGLTTVAELEAAEDAADNATRDLVSANFPSEDKLRDCLNDAALDAARAAALVATSRPLSFDRSILIASHSNMIASREVMVRGGDTLPTDVSHLVRDIFGNPFRPMAFDLAWRTDTAVTLARQMYDSREFGAMPILADALQDAGCEDEQVLHHCRDANHVHVRGCWVVDGVLGLS